MSNWCLLAVFNSFYLVWTYLWVKQFATVQNRKSKFGLGLWGTLANHRVNASSYIFFWFLTLLILLKAQSNGQLYHSLIICIRRNVQHGGETLSSSQQSLQRRWISIVDILCCLQDHGLWLQSREIQRCYYFSHIQLKIKQLLTKSYILSFICQGNKNKSSLLCSHIICMWAVYVPTSQNVNNATVMLNITHRLSWPSLLTTISKSPWSTSFCSWLSCLPSSPPVSTDDCILSSASSSSSSSLSPDKGNQPTCIRDLDRKSLITGLNSLFRHCLFYYTEQVWVVCTEKNYWNCNCPNALKQYTFITHPLIPKHFKIT